MQEWWFWRKGGRRCYVSMNGEDTSGRGMTPPLLKRGVWRQRRCFQWKLQLGRWSSIPDDFWLTLDVKEVMSLEQGGESKASFVNHGPDDVGGPASLSSLRETAAFWNSWPHCCRAWRGWGECPQNRQGLHPSPTRPHWQLLMTLACHFQLPFETHQALPDPFLQ